MNNMCAPDKERSFLTGSYLNPQQLLNTPVLADVKTLHLEDCHFTNDMIAKLLGGDLS